MLRRVMTTLAMTITLAGSALAQDWRAIVIGQPGPGAARAFADAYHAAEAFRVNGFSDVALLRDAPRDRLLEAFGDAGNADRVVVYFAGPLLDNGTTLQVKDDVLQLSAIVDWFQQAGMSQAAILIENCADPLLQQSQLTFPPVPDDIEMYLAASAAPGEDCGTIETRLTDQLKDKVANPGGSLQESLTGLPAFSTLFDPIPLRAPDIAPAPVGEAPVVSVVSSSVVSIAPVSTPVQNTVRVTPVAAPAPRRATATGGVVVFEPPPDNQIAALPVAPGLPEPYIIIGLLPQQEEAFDTVAPPGDVGATEITYENLAERRRLRTEQPELFATLVSSGAFDPPASLLVVALQTELERMSCYTGGVDGQWGRGSRGGVTRYFDQIEGVEAVSLDPEVPLFRQIILRDDVLCPAVARAAAPAATATRTTTTRTRTQQAAPARRQAAPAPRQQAPARAQTQPRIRLGTGSGVFR